MRIVSLPIYSLFVFPLQAQEMNTDSLSIKEFLEYMRDIKLAIKLDFYFRLRENRHILCRNSFNAPLIAI